MDNLLGVLGGMGPLATVDFMRKLIAETPALRDEDHIPVVVYSVPQIPDRPRAILSGGESPLPALLEGIRTLKQAGAAAIAIPCNTAHFWYDDMVRAGGLPILHIADATLAQLALRRVGPGAVGLIGTKGTLAAGFFQQRLESQGYRCIVNSVTEQDELVLPAITHVKRNELDAARPLVEAAIAGLLANDAAVVVLACTEIPVVLDRIEPAAAALCIDATRALASACVAWWQGRE